MAVGLIGWSGAWQPWQLFLAAIPSAVGWATTSGAARNAIVARWFDRDVRKRWAWRSMVQVSGALCSYLFGFS